MLRSRQSAYVVILQTERGYRTSSPMNNRRKSIGLAKKHPGSEVWGIERDWFRTGGSFGWDVATLKVCGECVYGR
jgi:hypothetical protein